jgi:SAM-dependent methyltransferase
MIPYRLQRIYSYLSTQRDFARSGKVLRQAEPDLADRVSLRVHESDTMYLPGQAEHYLKVGMSAVHCIRHALNKTSTNVQTILDFPCGYGRELRFLRAMFPDAQITAAELDPQALEFCRTHFNVETLQSDTDSSQIKIDKKFDLIWCGSLLTHIDEQASRNLLQFFAGHLAKSGICIVTSHGKYPLERLERRESLYGLDEQGREKLLGEVGSRGFGFADYPTQSEYGISASTAEYFRSLTSMSAVLHLERGWDNHQDVFVFKSA